LWEKEAIQMGKPFNGVINSDVERHIAAAFSRD
jgi:hypothetical protein